MSELIAVAFDDPHKSEEARLAILKLEDEDLADFEEAVVLVVDREGKVRLHHSEHFTMPAAFGGGFLGMLAGLILFNPALALVGGLTGAAVGAVMGASKELGIEEDFMKDLAKNLKPGSSALFVVARRGNPERIIDALKPFEGRILQTSLSHHDEAKLRKALEKVQVST